MPLITSILAVLARLFSRLIPSFLFSASSLLPFILFKIFASLGLGYATYKGLDLLGSTLIDYVGANAGQLPSQVLSIVGRTKVDICMSIIVSAISIRFSLKGVTDGSITSLIFRQPTGAGSIISKDF